MADVGTITITSFRREDGSDFQVDVTVSSYSTGTWHFDINRLTGTSEPEGLTPTFQTINPALGNQTFYVSFTDNSLSEIQYQGEQFEILLKTGGTLGSGTLIDSQSLFILYDDDLPVSSVSNVNVAYTATSHTPSIVYAFSGAATGFSVETRIKSGGTVYSTFYLTSLSGTATPTVNDVPAAGGSKVYQLDFYNGYERIDGPTYTVTRDAPPPNTYDVFVFADNETGAVYVQDGGSSTNRIQMKVGDVLNVTHSAISDASSITVGTFSSSVWTVSSDLTISNGSSGSRTVKTSPTLGTINLTVSSSGYTSGTIYVDILSADDSFPDAFSFTDLTNVQRSSYYYENVQITGITTATSRVSGTNFEQRLDPGDSWTTSDLTVVNGDVVYVRLLSSSSYSTAANGTLQVGDVSGTLNVDYRQDTFTVTTRAAPDTTKRVSIGRSSPVAISLDRLRRLVGPKNTSNQFLAAAMGNYYRGGTYVPDLTSGSPNNSGVPASGVISLSNFYDSCTYIEFESMTGSKAATDQAGPTGGSATVTYVGNTDWTLGYGPSMTAICEYRYRYDFVYDLDEGASQIELFINTGTAVDITSYLSSNYTTAWESSFGNVEFTLNIGNFATYTLGGKLTVEARHPFDTSVTTSAVSYFDLVVYSGV